MQNTGFGTLDVEFIRSEENIGFPGGNNKLAKYAIERGAEYVLLLNSDTVVDPEAIDAMVRKLQESEDIGAVGPKIYEHNSREETNPVLQDGLSNVNSRNLYKDRTDKGQFNRDLELDNLSGAAIMIKATALEKVNYLDERYFLYAEDKDLCCKLIEAGHRLIFTSSSIVWHKKHQSTLARGRHKQFYYYYYTRSTVLFIRKHFSILLPFPRRLIGLTRLVVGCIIDLNYIGLINIIKGFFDGITSNWTGKPIKGNEIPAFQFIRPGILKRVSSYPIFRILFTLLIIFAISSTQAVAETQGMANMPGEEIVNNQEQAFSLFELIYVYVGVGILVLGLSLMRWEHIFRTYPANLSVSLFDRMSGITIIAVSYLLSPIFLVIGFTSIFVFWIVQFISELLVLLVGNLSEKLFELYEKFCAYFFPIQWLENRSNEHKYLREELQNADSIEEKTSLIRRMTEIQRMIDDQTEQTKQNIRIKQSQITIIIRSQAVVIAYIIRPLFWTIGLVIALLHKLFSFIARIADLILERIEETTISINHYLIKLRNKIRGYLRNNNQDQAVQFKPIEFSARSGRWIYPEGNGDIVLVARSDAEQITVQENFEHIILDLDGVILDTIPITRECAAYMYWKIVIQPQPGYEAKEPTEEELEQGRDFSNREIAGRSMKEALPKMIELAINNGVQQEDIKTPAEYFAEYRETRNALMRKAVQEDPEQFILPGAREFLRDMKKRGTKLYIASAVATEQTREEILDALDITKYFERIVLAGSQPGRVEAIRQIMEEEEILLDDVVYVDDAVNSAEDVKAKIPGLFIVGIVDRLKLKGKLYVTAHIVIDNLIQLYGVVNEIARQEKEKQTVPVGSGERGATWFAPMAVIWLSGIILLVGFAHFHSNILAFALIPLFFIFNIVVIIIGCYPSEHMQNSDIYYKFLDSRYQHSNDFNIRAGFMNIVRVIRRNIVLIIQHIYALSKGKSRAEIALERKNIFLWKIAIYYLHIGRFLMNFLKQDLKR